MGEPSIQQFGDAKMPMYPIRPRARDPIEYNSMGHQGCVLLAGQKSVTG